MNGWMNGQIGRQIDIFKIEAGKMDQRLRALAALAEDPDLVPNTHVMVQN